MLYLYFAIWIINILLLFSRRKNNFVVLISICYLIAMYFWSTKSGDYQNNYENYMYHTQFDQLEIGYTTLIGFFNSLGTDFIVFQGIICSICLITTIYIFGKFSRNYHLFFSIYLIYQCFYDMDTLKNYIARVFLFIAIYYLIKNRKIYYIVFVLIGCLFHRSLLLYLPLCIINYNFIKYNRVKLFIGLIVFSIVLVYIIVHVPNVFDFLTRIKALENIAPKIKTYFSTSSRITFIVYYFLHCLNLVFLVANKKSFEHYAKLYNIIFILDIYVMISFPLIIINNVFFRIFNNLYLINYVAYAVVLSETNSYAYRKKILEIMLINACFRLPFVHSSAEFRRVLM